MLALILTCYRVHEPAYIAFSAILPLFVCLTCNMLLFLGIFNQLNGRPAEDSGRGGHGSVQAVFGSTRRFKRDRGTSDAFGRGDLSQVCATFGSVHLAESAIQPQVSFWKRYEYVIRETPLFKVHLSRQTKAECLYWQEVFLLTLEVALSLEKM